MTPFFTGKNLYRFVGTTYLLILLGSTSVQAQSIGSDTLEYYRNLEYEIVREINLARTDPQKYGFLMQDSLSSSPKKDENAVNEAIEFLNSATPIKPLKLSKGMSRGARDHVKDIGPEGKIDHTGSDNSESSDRMSRYGEWGTAAGENIAYGRRPARKIIMDQIVDARTPSRGHRKNIFNSSFKFVGVACGYHAKYQEICVTPYAAEYSEANQNE